MLGAQDRVEPGEDVFEQWDRPVECSCFHVGGGEAALGREGAGVVGPQGLAALREGLLVQGDGLVESARLQVGARQDALGGERVRVRGS